MYNIVGTLSSLLSTFKDTMENFYHKALNSFIAGGSKIKPLQLTGKCKWTFNKKIDWQIMKNWFVNAMVQKP